VVLTREKETPHLDAGQVHLLSSASLDWLRDALPDAKIDERRFRPNLLISLPGNFLAEPDWIGKRIRVGQEVELKVCASAERCGMVAFAQSELPRDPRILRHIAQAAGLRFGVYAEVVVPGRIRTNDRVAFVDNNQRTQQELLPAART
jgi:uncharacterized protein YcbX